MDNGILDLFVGLGGIVFGIHSISAGVRALTSGVISNKGVIFKKHEQPRNYYITVSGFLLGGFLLVFVGLFFCIAYLSK